MPANDSHEMSSLILPANDSHEMSSLILPADDSHEMSSLILPADDSYEISSLQEKKPLARLHRYAEFTEWIHQDKKQNIKDAY